MNKPTENIYKIARIESGLRRDPAAEELNIDVRTLDKYESLEGNPPDDVVYKMCVLYKNTHLAYQHIQKSPLAEFLPELKNADLKSAALTVIGKMGSFDSMMIKIANITADGKITPDEIKEWSNLREQLKELATAIDTLIFAQEEM